MASVRKPKEKCKMANQGGNHEQHVKSGQQGHKGASASAKSAAGAKSDASHSAGTQGGNHEQHVKAGQQSHKNKH